MLIWIDYYNMGIVGMNLHYCVSLAIEIIGICIVSLGLIEMCVFKIVNPASFLITGGSLIMAIGSAIFAKYIKWNRRG